MTTQPITVPINVRLWFRPGQMKAEGGELSLELTVNRMLSKPLILILAAGKLLALAVKETFGR